MLKKLFCRHDWSIKGLVRTYSLLYGKIWCEVFECKKCEKTKTK
jgi:hypothetical protein